MANVRFQPRPDDSSTTTAFTSAEEAWFWFVRCQEVRRDGARFGDSGNLQRPCDPDDIYLAAVTLHRRGLLNMPHLTVLGRFGLRGYPPDARCRDEQRAARLWDEALDRLSTILREKGIVC